MAQPFLRRLVGGAKGEGREEEGSGDSEQDVVALLALPECW